MGRATRGGGRFDPLPMISDCTATSYPEKTGVFKDDVVISGKQHRNDREFPTHPSGGGVIPSTFAQHPRLQGEMGERGEGEEGGKGREEEKGRDPQGLVDTPHVPNAEKYPAEMMQPSY